MPNDELTKDPNVTGVPSPQEGMTKPQEGVPDAPAEGMAPKDAVDVDTLRARLADAEGRVKKYESDMDRMRSSYDQRYSQDLARAREEARRAKESMQQAIMANMDEADKIAYERDIERERRLELEAELQRSEQQQNAIQSMNNYAQAFMKMGVDYGQLDFSSPDALYASGWKGVMQVQDDMKRRIDELEARGATPAEAQATAQAEANMGSETVAPPIMAQHGNAPSGTKTIGDVVKALNSQYPNASSPFTEDRVMELVGRGQLPVSILEGVDWDRSILGG
jgi:hypothetical protein